MEKRSLKICTLYILTVALLIVLLYPISVSAAKVQAFVDRSRTTLDESVNLTIKILGGEGSVDISSILDFRVVSRGTSSSLQIINNRVSREFSYNYALIPLKEGRLRIPPLPVISNGETLYTREISVQVSKQPQKDAASRDVFIEAELSESNPYEGQQVIYTFRLYSAVKVANAKLQRPSFSGFSVNEIKDNKSYRKVISGRNYIVTELGIALVPLKSGEMMIDPAVLECDIASRSNARRRNAFDSLFEDRLFGRQNLESKILRTESLTVNVRPLPEYSAETRFSGLVGKFDIRSAIETSELTVGDSTTVSVTIKGAGNIVDAEAPNLDVPEAIKVYADNPEEKITLDAEGFSGQKIFRFALVPVKPGKYDIAPVRLSYFDVTTHSYEIISTQPISIMANPSMEDDEPDVFSPPPTAEQPRLLKEKVEFKGRDILPLKEEMDVLKNQNLMSLFRFTALLLVPVFLFVGVKVALTLTKKSEDPKQIMAERAEQAIKNAAKQELSREEYLSSLYKALVSAIFSKAGTRGESLTYREAEDILRANGSSDDTAKQAAELLKKIESAKYSGLGIDGAFKADLLSEIKLFVKDL